MAKQRKLIAACEAALRLRLSREAVIRRVQRGELYGVRRAGRWFVHPVLRREREEGIA